MPSNAAGMHILNFASGSDMLQSEDRCRVLGRLQLSSVYLFVVFQQPGQTMCNACVWWVSSLFESIVTGFPEIGQQHQERYPAGVINTAKLNSIAVKL